MKTLRRTLCLVLALALSFSVVAGAASYDKYADAEAAAASKYAEAVDVVIGLGIINGTDGNKLDLDGTLTRAQAAKILCYLTIGEEAAEELIATNTAFSDVDASHWASKYIGYAAYMGYLAGSDGKFSPEDQVTGFQLAKMVLNARGYGISKNDKGETVNAYVGDYWTTAITLDANKAGVKLFTGLTGVKMNNALTRAQAMQMVFNAIEATPDTDSTVFAGYEVAKEETDVVDSYGRDGYYWYVVGDTDKTAVSGNYFESADYVYTASAAITAADLVAAYNKAQGLEKAEDEDKYTGSFSDVKAGYVVEFAVDAEAKTLTEITRYFYKIDTVANVATTAEASGDHKGAYKIDIAAGADTYTDVVSLKKGDIIVVPYVNATAVYADAKVATPVVAKISEIAADGSVLVAGGIKYNTNDAVANTTALEGAVAVTTALGFENTYNLYITPAGTVAGVTVYEEAAPAYTTAIAWLLDSQAQAYGDSSETDLIGNVSGDTTKAAVVLKIVDFKGNTKLLNVAIELNEDGDDYVYAGTDAITLAGEDEDLAVVGSEQGEVAEMFVEYYLDANGNAVIVAFYDDFAEIEEYAGAAYSIAGATANSKTVLNVIRMAEDDEGNVTYTAESFTGYKTFPVITTGIAYVNITADANVIYALALAEEVEETETVDAIAYCKAVGNLTAGGYAYTFVVDGKEVTYYNASNEAAEAGKFYKDLEVSTDGKNVFTEQDAEVVEAVVVSDTIDANYFVTEGGNIVEYAKNTTLINLTEEAVSAIAEGLVVVVFETATDSEGVVTDMLIFVTAVDAE